jgi:Tfp pilus assembly protein PilN
MLAERKKELEATLSSHTQALEGLNAGAFGRSEGYSGTLRALARVSVEGVWLTRIELSEDSGELSLAGRALRADLVPAYLARLRTDPSLRTQEFTRLEVTRAAAAPSAAGAAPAPSFVNFTLGSGGEAPKAK